MKQTDKASSWRSVGAVSALYLALSYAVGISIFLVALRYNEITDLAGRLAVVVDHPSLVFATNLLMYVVFGPALAALALAIRNEAGSVAREDAGDGDRARGIPVLVDLAAAVGVMWATSLVASGMIANAAIAPAVELAATDRAGAEAYWRAIETVTTGLGNGNGEILGSLFTLFASLAILKGALFPKGIAVLGLVACVPGFISVLPNLHDLAGIFGVIQLVWFVALALSFAKKASR